jgi:metal-dependent amidase/aminoacylase/carboxypeptidase family protein
VNLPLPVAGIVGSRAGAIMAGAHAVVVTIEGKGGHAAMPHTTVDPVVAGDFNLLCNVSALHARVPGRAGSPPICANNACASCIQALVRLAAAATVMALQSIVARETDPLGSTVISLTQA